MAVKEYIKWYHEKFKQDQSFPEVIQDHEMLIYLIDKYKIESIFEIGAWKGDSALLMYLYPKVKRLKTIDINSEMGIDYSHHLHEQQFIGNYGIKIKHTNAEFEFKDSRTCVSEQGYDMVFIDGDHSYKMVKNDTQLALRMNPKLIVWHDYGGGNDDVVKYVNELISQGYNIQKGTDIEEFPLTLVVYYEPIK